MSNAAIPSTSEDVRTPMPTFFSQCGEDWLLWRLFEGRRHGLFIDVGAFDGMYISNSLLFEQLGWSGICVEANAALHERCVVNRPGSSCVHAACVGDAQQRTVTLHVDDSGIFSAVDREEVASAERHYARRSIDFSPPEVHQVPAVTLNALLAEHQSGARKGAVVQASRPHEGHGRDARAADAGATDARATVAEIDFISIDVEGAELDVLRGIDLARHRPRVLVIEANTPEARQALHQYLVDEHAYHFARALGVNLFFCRETNDAVRLRSFAGRCALHLTPHPFGERFTILGRMNDGRVNIAAVDEANTQGGPARAAISTV